MTSFRARVRTLPSPPDSLPELLALLSGGLNEAAARSDRPQAMAALRRILYQAPGRELEGLELWREAVATAAFASQLAEARSASVSVAALAGLLHRAGEAYALRSMALAEAEHGVRIDTPSRSELCSTHGRDLAERLVREWSLPPAIGACVLGWRRFGEFSGVSREASAVYFGHLLAAELLHPFAAAGGAIEAAGAESGIHGEPVMDGVALARARAGASHVRALVCALE